MAVFDDLQLCMDRCFLPAVGNRNTLRSKSMAFLLWLEKLGWNGLTHALSTSNDLDIPSRMIPFRFIKRRDMEMIGYVEGRNTLSGGYPSALLLVPTLPDS